MRTPITTLRLGIQRLFRLGRGGAEPSWKTVVPSLEGSESHRIRMGQRSPSSKSSRV
ncbi:hypothetical protein [Archangium violaceum]|uniref:hypothetical protein n=1 Tax=Archangium violaceum TaxID=83451 RepID=UPI0036DBF0AD